MRHSEDELCANTQYNYDNHHFKDAKVLKNSISLNRYAIASCCMNTCTVRSHATHCTIAELYTVIGPSLWAALITESISIAHSSVRIKRNSFIRRFHSQQH